MKLEGLSLSLLHPSLLSIPPTLKKAGLARHNSFPTGGKIIPGMYLRYGREGVESTKMKGNKLPLSKTFTGRGMPQLSNITFASFVISLASCTSKLVPCHFNYRTFYVFIKVWQHPDVPWSRWYWCRKVSHPKPLCAWVLVATIEKRKIALCNMGCWTLWTTSEWVKFSSVTDRNSGPQFLY